MTLLLTPLRWLTSSILRLTILAAILVAGYFLLLKPAIDNGENSVSRSLHSLEKKASPKRLEHCVTNADGDIEKIKRCARPF